jgi:23S rRNA pseudouridine1911/1915/1917 synthase
MTAGGLPALPSTAFTAVVPTAESGARFDVWLSARLPGVSRTRIKSLVESGLALIDGRRVKPSHRLKAGETVEARIPPPPPAEISPEAIPLRILYEDDAVLVVDKPAGMVTHPGAGRMTGTLAAAALAHAPQIAGVGGPRRPGIVHRLDKGTSGAIAVAKTQQAYDDLTAQLARRSVSRRYLCVVHGDVGPAAGVIDKPIARDERSRVRMAIAREGRGKRAVTRFRVLERFRGATLVECRLETGRTHQIRVHMASLGHPLVGDGTYGRRRAPDLEGWSRRSGGVALHAAELGFTHPVTGSRIDVVSPLPDRIVQILSHLRRDAP